MQSSLQRQDYREARVLLLATRSSSNNNPLSKQQQEELWEENSAYFDDNDETTNCKHITSNIWPRSSYGRKLKKRAARPWMYGVEIRRLQPPHVLAGQLGLFAATPFQQFDIIGEYCGQVYEEDDGSEYATNLQDSNRERYPLGVDASRQGNECRFINHYQGIAEEPNAVMKIAHVEELPRVMIVCTKDIAIGEELLLRYSDDYVEAYIDD